MLLNGPLTKEQLNTASDCLKNILALHNLDSCYRVIIHLGSEENPSYIFLREGTGPGSVPGAKEQASFRTLLESLKNNQSITYADTEITFRGQRPDGEIGTEKKEIVKINGIDIIKLKTFLDDYRREEVLKDILTQSLELYQLKGKYRIEHGENFSLRPSTQNPPTESDQKNIQTVISLLTEIGLIESEIKATSSPACYVITKIDEVIINFYDQKPGKRLYDKEYAKFDFNPLTWLYIDYCLKKDLRGNTPPSLNTAIFFKDDTRDPITQETAMACPVVTSLQQTQPYELSAVLTQYHIDESQDNLPRDMLTRQPLQLTNSMPAFEVFQKINAKLAGLADAKIQLQNQGGDQAVGLSYAGKR